MEVKEISYENYGKCVQISNGIIEVAVTIEMGPRIVRFGFLDGENMLYNDLARACRVQNKALEEAYGPGSAYYHYGGHRLWIAPESVPKTYYPDNDPVIYGILPEGVGFTPPRQRRNDLQFKFEVIMSEGASDIMLVHSVKNCSKERQGLALWAVTMMKPGGVEIIPQNRPDENPLLPNRVLATWPYSDLRDSRIFVGDKYITVRQDPALERPMKLGTNNVLGWAAYAAEDCTLVKRYVHNTQSAYPDFGCSYETYVNRDYLEMETLSPFYKIEPGEAVRHVENLALYKTANAVNPVDEDAIDRYIENLK